MGLKKSWAYWMVGISIFLGLLNLGYEVVGILGKTVYTFDFYNGFAC